MTTDTSEPIQTAEPAETPKAGEPAAPARRGRKELRERADRARRRLAQLTLWFPVAGSVIILANVGQVFWFADNEVEDGAEAVASAFVQLWGLYGPYLVAITAYLWTQQKVSTGAEKAPNGWQMSVLAHSFTMQLIILIYSVPLVIYLTIETIAQANRMMAIYQSAVHTFTAAAITYFFARPEEDATAGARG